MEISRVPEIDMGRAQVNILHNIPFLDNETLDALNNISGKIVEIEGGLGFVSEELSKKNDVVLVEEHYLFLNYRNQIFPSSKVKVMNVWPGRLDLPTPFYDWAIIHSPTWLAIAKRLAKVVINIKTKEVYYGEVPLIDSEEFRAESKNEDVMQGPEEGPGDDFSDVELEESTGYRQDTGITHIEPLGDLE